MNFVGSVCVPYDQFSILRSRDDMSFIGSPVQRVDLGKMTFECTSDFESKTGEGRGIVGHCTDFLLVLGDKTSRGVTHDSYPPSGPWLS